MQWPSLVQIYDVISKSNIGIVQILSYYTHNDIQLIAHLDELHDPSNGKALKKFCERAYCLFPKAIAGDKANNVSPTLYRNRMT